MTETPRQQSRFAWVVMSQLWAMDLLATVLFFSVGVLIPIWTDDLGLTLFEAGVLGSAGFLGFVIMSLPAAIWLTRYRPRLVVLLSLVGMGTLALAQAEAPTSAMLIAARFGFVLLAVVRIQMHVLFIQEWFQPRHYAQVNSIEFGIRGVAQTLSVAATPFLVTLLGGWRALYGALAAGLLALSAVWLIPSGERGRRSHTDTPRPAAGSPAGVLRRHKSLWVVAASQLGAAMAFGSFVTFYPAYAIDTLGLSLSAAGLLMSLYPIGSTVGAFAAGTLSELLRRRKPLVWAPGLLLPIFYTLLLRTESVPLIGALLFGAGACALIVPPILMTIPLDMRLPPREVAVAIGLIRTFAPIGATLGPVFVGSIQGSTGSLFVGLSIVGPLALSLFIAGVLMPETSPIHRPARRGAA